MGFHVTCHSKSLADDRQQFRNLFSTVYRFRYCYGVTVMGVVMMGVTGSSRQQGRFLCYGGSVAHGCSYAGRRVVLSCGSVAGDGAEASV